MTIDFPKEALIPDLRALWKEAFRDTELFLDGFFRTGFSKNRCRCILENDKPVAALYWFDCHWQERKLAYVYAVATATSHRGRGLCHELMEDTQQLLLQLGYAGVVLVPAKPALFDFYKGMGYRCFGGIRQWNATAGDPIPVTELNPAQYAAARVQYLPANSVVQAGKLLDFLGTYARFYQGDDWLMCCADDEGKLMAYELLGNPTADSGILGTLGFATGTFRTMGESPFAMYRSLTEDSQMPAYFAFALD